MDYAATLANLVDGAKKVKRFRGFGTVLGLLLILDACSGLRYGRSLIAFTHLFGGDVLWMLMVVECIAGLIIAIRNMHGPLGIDQRIAFIISVPLTILTLLTMINVLVIGGMVPDANRDNATINFNLSAVGLSALFWGAAYLSIAAGLTLTYKVQRYGNFAQAEFMLVGTYVAMTMMWSDRFFEAVDAPKDDILTWDLLIWACIGAFVITGLVGVFIDRALYRGFRRRQASPQTMMIASLGVAMLLRSLLYLRYGSAPRLFIPDRDWRLSTSKFDIPTRQIRLQFSSDPELPLFEWMTEVNDYGYTYGKVALVIGVFGSVLLFMLVLKYTTLGRRMRAVADNPSLAASSGINIERTHTISSFISAGLSGLGGALFAMVMRTNPEMGLQLLLPAFAVIVFGTIGSIGGAFFGAIILGLVRSSSEQVFIGLGYPLGRDSFSAFAETMPYVVLILVLLVMPQGVGHRWEQWRIERIRRKSDGESRTFVPESLRVQFGRFRGGVNKCTITVLAPISKARTAAQPSIQRIRDGVDGARSKANKMWTELALKHRAASAWSSTTVWWRERVRPRITAALPSGVQERSKRWTQAVKRAAPHGRESNIGSWFAFGIMFLFLAYITWGLPSVTLETKVMQVARIIVLLAIFAIISMSLNLHTGMAGMVNFGVIFFAGISAIIVGILCAPIETNGYGWSPWKAMILGVAVAALAGWLLAYPTARLRMDYFAIVTISLGEMLRIALNAEPMLRAGTVTSAIGISVYTLPLRAWWEGGPSETVGGWLGLEEAAPYVVLLAGLSVIALLAIWWLLSKLYTSPWGRILRSIREDEEVTQHHGHDIFQHKASALALGAAIAGVGGVLWAWLNTSIFPDFMNPARTTFLIWAAFIVGGRANDRGMVVGAFLIVIMEFVFNVMVVARGDSDLSFHTTVSKIDEVFAWLVQDLGGYLWSQRSIDEAFPSGAITAELAYVKLGLVGLVILLALRFTPKGLIPEVPYRPEQGSEAGGGEE